MKVVLSFKTPDVTDNLHEEITDYIKQTRDLSPDSEEYAELFEHLHTSACDMVAKFVKYGEYLDVEVDLGTGKAEVLPCQL